MVDGVDGDLCGVSGIDLEQETGPASCSNRNIAGGDSFVPSFEPFSPGRQARRESIDLANVGIASRRISSTVFCAPCSAIPIRRPFAPVSLSATASSASTDSPLSTATSRQQNRATRSYTTGFPMIGPVRPRQCCSASADASDHRPSRAPVYPIFSGASNELNISDPEHLDPVCPVVLGQAAALARPDTAIEVRYVGNRNHHAWTTETGTKKALRERLHRRVEPRRRISPRTSRRAAPRPAPARSPSRPRHRQPPLPIYLALPGVERVAAQATRRSTRTRTSATRRRPGTSATTNQILTMPPTICTQPDVPRKRDAPGQTPNFFEMNPGLARRTSQDRSSARGITRCRSSCAAPGE